MPPGRPTQNRLAAESSPYLVQHAGNPVNWYPWGPDAFAKAKAEDKPILLSVGYAACHWCHVMAHESFEDEATAALMNELFVSIKVDREERPDVNDVYQHAIQLLGQGGGWPLTAFLTPDGRPFFGGTYFPLEDRHGRPGFKKVLHALHEAYRKEPGSIEHNATALLAGLAKLSEQARSANPASRPPAPDEAVALVAVCARRLLHSYDEKHGGIGTRPKFPNVSALEVWPRRWAHDPPELDAEYRKPFLHTLTQMARGGIYDQLGGGFARYSTDEHWLVPHFEKMLYDNAQLVRAYLDGFRMGGDPLYRRVVEETLEYVRREMTAPEGCFYSTQDADSPSLADPAHNEEGAFFVWSPAEVSAVLGEELGARASQYLGVSEGGNFEDGGKSVLSIGTTLERARLSADEWAKARRALWEARERRPRPGLDDKVLTSWNGLMVSALARAYEVLGDPRALADARRCVDFVWQTMRGPGGRLLRTCKRGMAAKILAFLDDYAFFAEALLDLYEAAGDPDDLARALELSEAAVDLFWDPARSVWYLNGRDAEALVHRPESSFDGAIPSGGAVATSNALRLSLLVGGERGARLRKVADASLAATKSATVNNPFGLSRTLGCLDFLGTVRELVVVGPPANPATRALLAAARGAYLPNRVLVLVDPAAPPAGVNPELLAGKGLVDGKPAAYVCKDFACQAPLTDPAELSTLLREGTAPERSKVIV